MRSQFPEHATRKRQRGAPCYAVGIGAVKGQRLPPHYRENGTWLQ